MMAASSCKEHTISEYSDTGDNRKKGSLVMLGTR